MYFPKEKRVKLKGKALRELNAAIFTGMDLAASYVAGMFHLVKNFIMTQTGTGKAMKYIKA